MQRKMSFRLKGGKLQAGFPYDGIIESVDVDPGVAFRLLGVELPADTGLESDPGQPARLWGTPTRPGDLAIGVIYELDGAGGPSSPLTASLSVFVNHDPRSLWKDLPSDRSDPHWKPDAVTTLRPAGARTMLAASKRGRSHAHEGKFRDDDYRIAHADNCGWTVVAVADGAGSASHSRLGSKVAVDRAVDLLLGLLDGAEGDRLETAVAAWRRGETTKAAVIRAGLYPVLGAAAFAACKAIDREAADAGLVAKDLATTLLLAIYKPAADGHLFATYWVGDGAIGVCLTDGTPQLLGKVDSGEFAGQTRFLDHKVMTPEELAARLDFTVVDDFRSLIAMTDGVTDPYFMTDSNLERREPWDNLWQELAPLLATEDREAAMLGWLDFWSPGNHDDRTIAVLW